MVSSIVLLCLSDHNKKGTNMNSRTMENGWHHNKGYEVGATCWAYKWVYKCHFSPLGELRTFALQYLLNCCGGLI